MSVADDGITEVFVASPIGSPGSTDHANALTTLNYIIRKSLTEPNWKVIRADQETSPDSITQGVVRRIIESDLIVVDLTSHNPNVFYELAIAHCYRKPVVLMAAVGTPMPFDVADQRTIFYELTSPESVDKAKTALLAAANKAIESPDGLVTPLTNMQHLTEVSSRLQAGESNQLIDLLESVSSRLTSIERAVRSPELLARRSDGGRDVRIGRSGSVVRRYVMKAEVRNRWDALAAEYLALRAEAADINTQGVTAYEEKDEQTFNNLNAREVEVRAALEEIEQRSLDEFGLPITSNTLVDDA